MKVYVVMGNDFPDAVFQSEKHAEEYCDLKRSESPQVFRSCIHWRVYEFEVQ